MFNIQNWNKMKAVFTMVFFWGSMASAFAGTQQINVKEAFDRVAKGEIILVDIREPQEWRATGVAPNAKLLSMRDPKFLPKLKQLKLAFSGRPIAIICAHGNRSRSVQSALASYGYPNIIDVKLGMDSPGGWIKRGLPTRQWKKK